MVKVEQCARRCQFEQNCRSSVRIRPRSRQMLMKQALLLGGSSSEALALRPDRCCKGLSGCMHACLKSGCHKAPVRALQYQGVRNRCSVAPAALVTASSEQILVSVQPVFATG